MPESSEAIDQTQKPETFLHTVVVDVPTEETQLRMTRLLEVLTKVDDVQAQKASRVSDFNAELKQLNKEAHKLRDAITTGKERRDVECYESADERRNIVFIVRASDGKVIDERAMTLEDRMYAGADKAKAEAAEREANGDAPPSEANEAGAADASESSGSGGADAGEGKTGPGGKVVRIKPSEAKKRKAAREEAERKAAEEKAAAEADDEDDDSDDDSDEDDDE